MLDELEMGTAVREVLGELLPPNWSLEFASRPTPSLDAVLVATDPSGGKLPLFVELKRTVHPPDVSRLLVEYQGQRGLVAANHVSPRSREALEEAGWSWLDLDSQEVVLAIGGLGISRVGSSTKRRQATSGTQVKAVYSGASLRVVRWLLIDPTRRWTVEAMGERARVSISFASRVFATLAARGWVERSKGRTGGTVVADPAGLLDDWAQAAPPPHQVAQRVSLLPSPLQISRAFAAVADARYALTGEAAAEFVRPFARYSVVDVYVDSAESWDRALSLTQVSKGGNVRLIVPPDGGVFDGAAPRAAGQPAIVTLPQLYVDLYRQGGPAREAADFLRGGADIWPWP